MQDKKAMTAPEPVNEVATLRLEPFLVSTARAEVKAFRDETGWGEAERSGHLDVPHTFPMRWLTGPELRSVLEEALQSAGGIAIHESQSFVYENSLSADQDYLMTAEIGQQLNPQRLIVKASVVTQRQEPLLQMETILRIIPVAGAVR